MTSSLPDDICRNNHGGNAQSEVANVRTRKSRDRSRIYAYVHAQGWRGATCDEVTHALGMETNTTYPRFSELKRDGDLIDTAQRRPTRRGNCPAAVFITRGTAIGVGVLVEQRALI